MVNKKNNLIILGIIIISLVLIGTAGITLAFNDKGNNINLNTLELSVNYSDVIFSSSDLVPINDLSGVGVNAVGVVSNIS